MNESKTEEYKKIRINEWNNIYLFMEWLQEKGYFLARHQTPEEAEENEWQFEYPIAVGKSIEQLLYEYFGVDPVKLEKERRQLLEKLREKHVVDGTTARENLRGNGKHFS